VDVLAPCEGRQQVFVLRDVGQDAQLHLRVVCRENDIALFRDKGPPDFAAQVAADGNVLEIRVGGAEAARLRACLIKRGMDSAGTHINQAGQRVHVSAQQLAEHPLFEDQVNDVMPPAQPFQHIRRCGVAAGLRLLQSLGRQAQLAEQHVGELLRRIDVERVAGQFLDRALQLLLDAR
jgi:hypothetical protein